MERMIIVSNRLPVTVAKRKDDLSFNPVSETARGIRNIDREMYNNLIEIEMILKNW